MLWTSNTPKSPWFQVRDTKPLEIKNFDFELYRGCGSIWTAAVRSSDRDVTLLTHSGIGGTATAMLSSARFAFWLALPYTFVMAVLPHPPPLPGEPSDKFLHILAFSVLTLLAAIGYPKLALARLMAGLIAFGALIEAAQAIPALNRSSELADLLADAAAVVAVGLATRWGMRRVGR